LLAAAVLTACLLSAAPALAAPCGWRGGQSWSARSHNFQVPRAWNKSAVYRKTIAVFASRLSGQ
jgi:membrane-bound lytic murein transglycosylase B